MIIHFVSFVRYVTVRKLERTPMHRVTLVSAVILSATLALAASPSLASAERTTTAAGRCIELDQVVRRIVVAPDVVEFGMVGGAVLRNRLLAPCPRIEELDRFSVIQFDANNGRRMCRGDRFRVVDQQLAAQGGSASSPWCRFGAFEPTAR
jgi:hypothetical protein